LSKNTNKGQQNTIQKTTISAKHKQWSTKYFTENDYLSKNTNNGQQNTIQRTTIRAKAQIMVSKILYRKRLFEQKHKQWSAKYYTENDY
jgi:hypothetical protein